MSEDNLNSISNILNTNSLAVPTISDDDYKNSNLQEKLDALRAKCRPPKYFPNDYPDHSPYLYPGTGSYIITNDGYYLITVSTQNTIRIVIEKNGEQCTYVVQDCDGADNWATSVFTLYLQKGMSIFFNKTGASNNNQITTTSDPIQIIALPLV